MQLLKSPLAEYIQTKATPSVSAKCTNMKRFLKKNEHSTDERVMFSLVESICRKFWERNHHNWSIEYLFKYVNPEELEGLEKSLSELNSWEHKFGHTPKFLVNIKMEESLSVDLKIENGLVVDFEINGCNHSEKLDEFNEFRKVLEAFVQSRLDYRDLRANILNQTSSNYYVSKFYAFLNKHFI